MSGQSCVCTQSLCLLAGGVGQQSYNSAVNSASFNIYLMLQFQIGCVKEPYIICCRVGPSSTDVIVLANYIVELHTWCIDALIFTAAAQVVFA